MLSWQCGLTESCERLFALRREKKVILDETWWWHLVKENTEKASGVIKKSTVSFDEVLVPLKSVPKLHYRKIKPKLHLLFFSLIISVLISSLTRTHVSWQTLHVTWQYNHYLQLHAAEILHCFLCLITTRVALNIYRSVLPCSRLIFTYGASKNSSGATQCYLL